MVALFDPRLRLAHRLVESGRIDGRVPAADDSFEVEDEREQAGLATLAFEPGELGQRLGRVDLDADLLALDPEAVGLAQEANGEAAGDREARAIGKLALEPPGVEHRRQRRVEGCAMRSSSCRERRQRDTAGSEADQRAAVQAPHCGSFAPASSPSHSAVGAATASTRQPSTAGVSYGWISASRAVARSSRLVSVLNSTATSHASPRSPRQT